METYIYLDRIYIYLDRICMTCQLGDNQSIKRNVLVVKRPESTGD